MSQDPDQARLPGYDWRDDPLLRTQQQCDLHWYDRRISRQIERQHVRLMTLREKQELLQDFRQIYEDQSARARATLERLLVIAPDIAERLYVKPDPTDVLSFRLYACESHLPMSRYTAVSYCWLSGDALGSEQAADDSMLAPFDGPILQHIIMDRDDADEGIWCDQMCIAQSDEAEKTISVGAMDAVYQCARKVHVILHDVELTVAETKLILEYKRDYEDPKHDIWPPPHANDTPPYFVSRPEFHAIFVKICRAKWFTRAWCAHEFLLGRRFKFTLKSACIRGTMGSIIAISDFFLGHMALMASRVGVPSELQGVVEMIVLKCNAQDAKNKLLLLAERERDRREQVGTGNEADTSVLKQHHRAEAVVSISPVPSWALLIGQFTKLVAGGHPSLPPKFRHFDSIIDKTSIILNLTRSGLGITRLPYSTTPIDKHFETEQSRYFLTMTAIAACDPTALCTTGPPLAFSDNTMASRFWLADTSYADVGSGYARAHPLFQTAYEEFAHDTSPTREWIELQMLGLGAAHKTADKYRNEVAPLIIRHCSALGFGGSRLTLAALEHDPIRGANYDNWSLMLLIPDKAAMLQLTVANVLYLGLKWMLKTALHCGYGAPDELKKTTASYFSSGFDMDELLSLRWKQHKGGPEAVNAIIRFSYWMQAWNIMCTEHGSGKKSWIPVIFKEGWQTPVMSFWPTDAACNSYLPVTLLRDGYERLPRVWVLQSSGDPRMMQHPRDSRLFIRAKTILFGVPKPEEYKMQREEGCITRIVRIHGPLPSDLAVFGNRKERERQCVAEEIEALTPSLNDLHTVTLGVDTLVIESPD